MIEKIKKIGIIISFTLASLVSLVYADIVYLKDGRTIEGTVIGSDENSIEVRTPYGGRTWIYRGEVRELSMGKDQQRKRESL